MFDDLSSPEEEVYGPGTDLLISLFAMAMLLLSIVGVDRQFDFASQQTAGQRGIVAAPDKRAEIPSSGIPPLQIASAADMARLRDQLAAEEKRNAEILDRARSLERDVASKSSELEKAHGLLRQAGDQLDLLKNRPQGRFLDLLDYELPATVLRPYFGAIETFRAKFSPQAVQKLRSTGAAMPAGMNQLFIETHVPPALMAFLPKSSTPDEAMNRIYVLSAGVGQAYQKALAQAGIPLSCMTLTVRSFETSPEARREVMVDAKDAVDAFDELMAYYQGMSEQDAGKQEVKVTIRLGELQDASCDVELLSGTLKSL